MIPEQQKERIKQQANDNIVAVVERYVELKRSGSSYKGKCPFHEEKTASFSVSPQRQIYKCFGCGEGGDAIDFIMKMEGMTFIEAIRHLAGMLGIIINEEKGQTPTNYTPPSKVIPGIKEAKFEIRKEDAAIISCNKETIQSLRQNGQKNAVLIDDIQSPQAQLLAKYLSAYGHVNIICKGFSLTTLFNSILTIYKQNLNVKLAKNKDEKFIHWMLFISNHFENNDKIREAHIKIISSIPDTLKRSIETQYFINTWDH